MLEVHYYDHRVENVLEIYAGFSAFMKSKVIASLLEDTSDLQTVRIYFYSPLVMPMLDVLTEKMGFEPFSVVSIERGSEKGNRGRPYLDIVFATPYTLNALIG